MYSTDLSIIPPEGDTSQDGYSIIPPVDLPRLPFPGPDLDNRSNRFHIAMGPDSPGLQSISNLIQTGQEDYLRDNILSNKVRKERIRQYKEITEIAKAGAGVDPILARDTFNAIKQPIIFNRDTVQEEEFGNRIIYSHVANSRDPESPVVEALNNNPQQVAQEVQGMARIIARREIAQNVYEDIKTQNKNMGWIEYGANVVGTMIPGVSAAATNPSSSVLQGAINITLPGSSMEQERDYFWSIRDLGEAKKWLQGRVNTIAEWNPLDAEEFAHRMVIMSSDDKYQRNLTGILDVATAPAMLPLKRSLKGASEAVVDGTVKPENVAAARGDLNAAGDILLVKQRTAKEVLNAKDPVGATQAIQDQLPSSYSSRIIMHPGQMGRERALKVGEIVDTDFRDAMGATANAPRAQRIPEENLPQMAAEKKDLILLQYPSLQDHPIDYRLIYDQAINSYFVEVVVGKRDGLFFKTANQADNYLQNELAFDFRTAGVSKFEPTDPLKVAADAANVAQSLVRKVEYIPGSRQGDKITGFNSIQGVVKLKDGLEIKVSNRKDGIYSREFPGLSAVDIKVNPRDIIAFRTSAKNAKWQDVVEPRQIKLGQQGNGWYISIVQPIDETTPFARSILSVPTTNQNPVTIGGKFLDFLESKPGGGLITTLKEAFRPLQFLRSGKDLVAPFQAQARSIATHAPTEMQRVFSEKAKRIGAIRGADMKELRAVLQHNMHSHSPDGQVGKAYRSQTELERAWLDINGNLPSDQQSLAYWTYHQLMDVDWVIRNMGVSRDLTRQGVQMLEMQLGSAELGSKLKTPGKFVEDLPWDHKSDFGFVLLTKDQPVTHYWKNKISPEDKESIQNMLKTTHQVHQIARPDDRPFADPTGLKSTVNFVVAPRGDVVQTPLPMNLVDYNPGIHVIYPQSWFVKTPIVETGEKGKLLYFGDKTIAGFNTKDKAIAFSRDLEEVRKMLNDKTKTDADIDRFISKSTLPEDAAYWRQKFEDPNTPMTKEHPISYVYSGDRVLENHPKLEAEYLEKFGVKELSNERNSEFNLYRSIDMDFLAHRDGPLNTVTRENSVYKFQPAKTFDPIIALQRGLQNAIKNLHNDHKISAIEQYAAQFGHLATNMSAAQAKANPFYFFYKGILNEKSLDTWELTAAKNVRARIQAFVGTNTEVGKDLKRMQVQIANMLGEKGGGWYETSKWTAPVRDPIAWIRGSMFHPTFGFFNPKQYFIQAQGFATVSGILTGAHGPAGLKMTGQVMGMYPMHLRMYINDSPSIAARAEKMAQAMGWPRGGYTESFNTMRQHGWDNVGFEHALREVTMDPGFITGKGHKFLDMGISPFKWGEALVRINSWHAAYLEWRRANPVKDFDIFGQQWVLSRADDLSQNMTRASNSRIQEGLVRVPSTFYTFSQRMFDLYAGKRLTAREKAGIFTTHSALYGVPTAAGAFTLFDIYDYVQQELTARGSPIRDMNSYKAFMDGFLSWALSVTTGTEYNFGKRYGPGLPDHLGKVLSGELPFLSAQGLGGAPGGIIERIMKDMYPFVMHGYYAMFGDKSEQYPIVTDDFLALAREISTVNDAMNVWMMLNTQKHFSKNGRWLGGDEDNPMTVRDAAAIAFGLTRKDVSEIAIYQAIKRNDKLMQDQVQVLAERELKRAFMAEDEGSSEKARQYFRRFDMLINIIGDFDEKRKRATFNKVLEENQPLIKKLQQEFIERGRGSQLLGRMKRLFGE